MWGNYPKTVNHIYLNLGGVYTRFIYVTEQSSYYGRLLKIPHELIQIV